MAEVAFDVVEQILLTLDATDLLRCKSVCKSWLSLISSPLFAKAHLKQTLIKTKYKPIDKRIIMHRRCHESFDDTFISDDYHIIGSSNGLVCISPKDFELLVINPLTRVVNYLPALPDEILPDKTIAWRCVAKPCWGFGYDLSTDDYKVVVGFRVGDHRTRFYVLALKSNIWKVIGDIPYEMGYSEVPRPGVLCEGSLHWFMNDGRNMKAIISFDLSLQYFNEIPQPDDLFYRRSDAEAGKLGFIEESLCIYKHQVPSSRALGYGYGYGYADEPLIYRPIKWIMRNYQVRNYQVTGSWEPTHYLCEALDVDPHYLSKLKYITHESSHSCRLVRFKDHMANPVFVPSLVSPPGDIYRLIKKTNDKRALKRKRRHAKNSKRNAKSIKKDHLSL